MQLPRGYSNFGLVFLAGLLSLGLLPDARADVIAEDHKLVASSGVNGDEFGFSVSVDGSFLGVGARMYGNGGTGAGYIFESDGSGGYTQIKKLVPTDAADTDRIGNAMVVSGDYAFLAGYVADIGEAADAGAVWVFQKDAGGTNNWGQVGKLTADTPLAGAGFGSSIAVNGDTLLVCAQNESYDGITKPGAAYLFQNDGSDNWTQIQRIQPSDPDEKDYFGQSCGLDGDTLAIGAHLGNKAYVFQDNGTGNWVEKKILEVSGTTGMGTGTTIAGDTVVVGAYKTAVDGVSQAGVAYVFDRDAGGANNWGQVAELLPGDGSQTDGYLGVATAIDGDKIVVGAYGQDGQGAAYAYGKSTCGVWVEIAKMAASDGEVGDQFGYRATLAGDTAFVGSTKAPGGWLDEPFGAVYTFTTPEIPSIDLIPGDANNDGSVDAKDAQFLANNWGKGPGSAWAMGDFNGDGYVNVADAAILAANWGPGPGEATAVPEPGVLAWFVASLGVFMMRRGRNR